MLNEPYPVFFCDPDEKATNRGHNPGSETPEREEPGMTETEAIDHLEGASQILQALAASPDCVGDGECLGVAASAIDAAVARIDAAKPALGAETE